MLDSNDALHSAKTLAAICFCGECDLHAGQGDDPARGVCILAVTVLAFLHRVQVWQLYLMNTLVAAGFWMFWPTITALIQELTPEGEFVQSNTFLLAGIQGGWLIAGALVGFVYEHIGLGGV